ncbi:MAG: hypothetical protein KGI04_00570 [Candidatus Micrarchaeota archaeon]|nr:hypothetical protein [Candidatus Micrarchaeota archaeon]
MSVTTKGREINIEGMDRVRSTYAQTEITETAQKASDTLSGWKWEVKEMYLHNAGPGDSGAGTKGAELVIIAKAPSDFRSRGSFNPLSDQGFYAWEDNQTEKPYKHEALKDGEHAFISEKILTV